ncbi:MAG: hypothetical protein F2934_08185 [Actinobacteria bacterium]|uniref:Unannotated protein n=1 Tax=freshwater metagenome TaxID=449393 RepID=A0A6J6UVQ6_9ZZZZ|nr:hypothetical protein [Actinomycetota bacterium]MSZ04642.1 hypothetical protein [Actinomycetota bacterium]MTB07090.1 hypothetical protein [Actinomycetota bacterium]
MLVRELIDFLRLQDPDAEVDLSFVQPDTEDDNSLDVIRVALLEVLTVPDDETGVESVWLVGGEDSDVEDFLDAISGDDDDED